MLISHQGVMALAKLCKEWQQDAGDEFPEGMSNHLLILYDVCKLLDLNIFQTQEVLSERGWRYVIAYISTPIGTPVYCTHNQPHIRQ